MSTNTFLKVLRDQIWQFAGCLLGVVSIIFFLYDRPIKSIQVVVFTKASAVQVENTISKDVVVLYKGHPINDLFVVTLKMENTGNQPIKKEDYANPITFSFPDSLEIIDSQIVDSEPKNIGFTITSSKNTAQLSSSLINPGDIMIIQFIIISRQKSFALRDVAIFAGARIAGVKDISVVDIINPFETTLRQIIMLMQGFYVRVLAAAATISILLGALLKKVSWGVALITIIGVAVIFEAPNIIQILNGKPF